MDSRTINYSGYPGLDIEPGSMGSEQSDQYVFRNGLHTLYDLERFYGERFARLIHSLPEPQAREVQARTGLDMADTDKIMSAEKTLTLACSAMTQLIAGRMDYSAFDLNTVSSGPSTELFSMILELDLLKAENLLISTLQIRSHQQGFGEYRDRIAWLMSEISRTMDLQPFTDHHRMKIEPTLNDINEFVTWRYRTLLELTGTGVEAMEEAMQIAPGTLARYLDKQQPDRPHMPHWMFGFTSQYLCVPRIFYASPQPMEKIAPRFLLIREYCRAGEEVRAWIRREVLRLHQQPLEELLTTD